MTVWHRLDKEVNDRHLEFSLTKCTDCLSEIKLRLQHLVDNGHCNKNTPWQLSSQKRTDSKTYTVGVSSTTGHKLGNHPCIELNGLHYLEDRAMLSFVIDITPGQVPAAQYAIGLVGRSRLDGNPWFARIDLGPRGQGFGLCSHPTLHGHVGHDPDSKFQARVPLPWLLPWEALEWLLSTVHPGLEPCPHP